MYILIYLVYLIHFFQKKKMEQDKKFYQGLFILSGTFILGFSVGYQVAI